MRGRSSSSPFRGWSLRYVTAELIREVLAVPCGVDVKDDVAARALFDDLAARSPWSRAGSDPTRLVLRAELRRTVLENLRNDRKSAAKRNAIHHAAVKFFQGRDGSDNRAEEIYHRLWLDQDAATLDGRWLSGVELSLRSAVEEFSGNAKAYLTNRVGGDYGAIAGNAPLAEWELYAEKRASDLLSSDLSRRGSRNSATAEGAAARKPAASD